MPAYTWRENNACVATYKVLEGDQFLDQFEEADLSFKQAGNVKLGSLRYFPKTTDNPQIVMVLSYEIARRFVTSITKLYTVRKQKVTTASAIIAAVAAVFADGGKKIVDLAQVVDAQIQFPDEK